LFLKISIEGKLGWSNCGGATDAIRLKTFDILPHPILSPGVSTFVLGVTFSQDMAEPIKVRFGN
jgi:hypothetical protein